MNNTIKPAPLGTVIHATHRTEDLLEAYADTLQDLQTLNGGYLSLPENRGFRDRLADAIGEAQDCWSDNGDLDPEKLDDAEELTNETLPDLLQEFAPPYCYFGAHSGDGADFGFWVGDLGDVKESVGFVSTCIADCPPDDFRGEWLHVSDHGNATLYLRGEDGVDSEIWSLV